MITPGPLWQEQDCQHWHRALQSYPEVIEAQGSERLRELDQWFREELPRQVAERAPAYLTLQEVVGAAEWKMLRGVWRPRNLQLVRANPEDAVQGLTADAFAALPDLERPLSLLARLGGVGPATASALLSAARPGLYPFFDELVAALIPELGPPVFTVPYYHRYANLLRRRADALHAVCPHHDWTPHDLDLALWAAVGGKKRTPRGASRQTG